MNIFFKQKLIETMTHHIQIVIKYDSKRQPTFTAGNQALSNNLPHISLDL